MPLGGAAVKFAVAPDEHVRDQLRVGLAALAERHGCQFAFVDARQTKVQLIDRLFHEVARQIDWERLARAFLARLLVENGYQLTDEPSGLRLERLAELNDVPEPQLRLDVTRWLWNRLFRDYAMSQEFRLAMVRLCRALLDPDDEPSVTDAVQEWLRGELRLISALKRALIFQKIARHNARHMLVSLAHWLTLAGVRGLVLGLDISRCAEAVPRAERDPSTLYYSPAAAFDAYEMLRQLIDGTDEVESMLVVVLADPTLPGRQSPRPGGYRALYYRLADEVHDQYRQNPLAALVRIGSP